MKHLLALTLLAASAVHAHPFEDPAYKRLSLQTLQETIGDGVWVGEEEYGQRCRIETSWSKDENGDPKLTVTAISYPTTPLVEPLLLRAVFQVSDDQVSMGFEDEGRVIAERKKGPVRHGLDFSRRDLVSGGGLEFLILTQISEITGSEDLVFEINCHEKLKRVR